MKLDKALAMVQAREVVRKLNSLMLQVYLGVRKLLSWGQWILVLAVLLIVAPSGVGAFIG